MSLFLIVFYFFVLLIIITGGLLVFLWLKHKSIGIRMLSAGLTMLLLTGIWPLPIHGGFMFLGEVMIDGIVEQWQKREKTKEKLMKTNFLKHLEARFTARMQYTVHRRLSPGWSEIVVFDGNFAWLDHGSGLIWSAPTVFTSTNPVLEIDQARQSCHQMRPAGHWSLPTEAERYYFWKAKGQRVLPDKVPPAVAQLVDESMQIVMPMLSLSAQTNTPNQPREIEKQLLLRCVAIGTDAPRRGYIRSDISLSEWNLYQSAKLKGQE